MTNTVMTKNEALLVIEEYYRYLRTYNMDHLLWDAINQAVLILGGVSDPTLDHEKYVRMYARSDTTIRQLIEEEILLVGHFPEEDHMVFPEPDKSLSAAFSMVLVEMERRGLE